MWKMIVKSILILFLFLAVSTSVSAVCSCSGGGGSSGDSGSGGDSSTSSIDSAITLLTKAKLEQGLGNTNNSLLLYENATVVNPFYLPVWTGYSDALRSSGNLTGANYAIDRAISLKPGDPELLIKKGDLLVGLGNITIANQFYEMARALNPNSPGLNEKIVNLTRTTPIVKNEKIEQINTTTLTPTSQFASSAKTTVMPIKTTPQSPVSIYSIVLALVAGCFVLSFAHKRN